MQFALHIGAQFTDEDRLIKALLKDKARLTKQGIAVPGPGRYRRLLRETLQGLGDAEPPSDAREILLDAILEQDKVHRVVLSNDNFICVPQRVFEDNTFYPQIEPKLSGFARIFEADELDLFLAIRNPATFITEMRTRLDPKFMPNLMGGVDPITAKWSEVILRIKTVLPLANLTVWCNEDTPYIWQDILRLISGDRSSVPMQGASDMISELLTTTGLERYKSYLSTNPPESASHLQRINAVFLEKFVREDLIDIELPEAITGWTGDYVDMLTESYEADQAQIATIPGVTFLRPVI
ncbi:MAG: hypothetical protein AAGD04_07490 [Pseudomonadota bacterium]